MALAWGSGRLERGESPAPMTATGASGDVRCWTAKGRGGVGERRGPGADDSHRCLGRRGVLAGKGKHLQARRRARRAGPAPPRHDLTANAPVGGLSIAQQEGERRLERKANGLLVE